MSEDLPKQPEPVKPEPQTPTPQGANAAQALAPQASGRKRQKVTQKPQPTLAEVQPFLKSLSIKTLRGTIHLLQEVVEKLEAEPVEPRRDIAGNISTPTGELPPVVVAPPERLASVEVLSTDVATDEADLELQDVTDSVLTPKTQSPQVISVETKKPSVATATPSVKERLRLVGLRLQGWQTAALQKIRSLLPSSVNQKLPDWGLTIAIAALVILPIWIPVTLLSQKPAPVPVAEVPPATIETPPELVAPQSPEPVKIEPPPEPVLTPEQNLIAGIQNQVAQITSQYADGLIQSIQANFEGSLLIVKVSDSWYNLSHSQQDRLANEMLSRSEELDFSKLEIRDSLGTVLARSPVVGGNMVILKRRVIAANL